VTLNKNLLQTYQISLHSCKYSHIWTSLAPGELPLDCLGHDNKLKSTRGLCRKMSWPRMPKQHIPGK